MNRHEAAPEGLWMHVMFDMCSQARCLPIVRATVGQLAAMFGWDQTESRAIIMAVDEALANVIRHATMAPAQAALNCTAAPRRVNWSFAFGTRAPRPTVR